MRLQCLAKTRTRKLTSTTLCVCVHTGKLSTLERINGLRQSSQMASSIALHLQPEAVSALEQAQITHGAGVLSGSHARGALGYDMQRSGAAALPREAATQEAIFSNMQTEHYVVVKHETSVVVRESPEADAAELGTLLP